MAFIICPEITHKYTHVNFAYITKDNGTTKICKEAYVLLQDNRTNYSIITVDEISRHLYTTYKTFTHIILIITIIVYLIVK